MTDPIYIPCHTCHAQSLEPCRWSTSDGQPFHRTRERARDAFDAGRLLGFEIGVQHAQAHGNACLPDSGGDPCCTKCGRNIAKLRTLAGALSQPPEVSP